MSLSKRILFGNDPADDAARAILQGQAEQAIKLFNFAIPTRRRNRLTIGGYWNSGWESCVHRAAEELKLEHHIINSRVCTKMQADAEAIVSQAEALYEIWLKDVAARIGRSVEAIRRSSITASRKRRAR